MSNEQKLDTTTTIQPSLSASPPPMSPSPIPTVPDPPAFASFVHLLSQSPSDLTALVNKLYTQACYSTDANTRQSAIDLLTDHTVMQQQLRTAEQKCLGKWILHNPPTSHNNTGEDSMLGTLTLATLTAQYVSGTLHFSLAHSFTLTSRSHHQQNTKLDSHGNIHLSFTVQLTPNRAVQDSSTPMAGNKRVEGTLDLQVSGSGERMSGEFMLNDERAEADDIEGDITPFVAVRAK